MSTTPKLIETLKQYRRIGDRWEHIFAQGAKRKGQCQVIYCKRFARTQVRPYRGKLRTVINAVCCTCESRLKRANNPVYEIWRQIRERARSRGQIFNITLDELMAVPRFDEYVQRRGRGIEDLHLDRVKVELGYVAGNLQVLTTEQNLRKQREVDYANHPF